MTAGRGRRGRNGWVRWRRFTLAAALALSWLAASAAAMPNHGEQSSLTVRALTVPSRPVAVAGGWPPKGTALAGRLVGTPPACERNRFLTGFFSFSTHANEEPVERSLEASTNGSGGYRTPPVEQFYSSRPERVRVYVVAERVTLPSGQTCPEVASPPITVKSHKMSVCKIERTCPVADSSRAALQGGTLSVKTKQVPWPDPPPPGYPPMKTILHGYLRSKAPACELNRKIMLTYRVPPTFTPIVRDLGIRTDSEGHWESEYAAVGVSPEPKVAQVVASTPQRGRCARVESPVTRIREQRIDPCAVPGACTSALMDTSGFTATAAATIAPTRLSDAGTPITLTIDATGTRPESPTSPALNPEYPMDYVDVRLDRQIRVDTEGLATCSAADLKLVTPPVARRKCGDALIGSGTEEVTALESAGEPGTFTASFDLLFFNGSRGRHPAVLMYRSYTRIPQAIARAIGTVSNLHIEDVGAEENRTITDSLRIHIGKTWRYKGAPHSYLNGRCATGTLRNSITLELDGGTLSETSPQPCTTRG